MPDLHDLDLLIRSQVPLVVVETHEEERIQELFRDIGSRFNLPLYQWTITAGLKRLEGSFSAQAFNREPIEVLGHIRNMAHPALFLMLDFHPYLEDPRHIRLIREIAQNFQRIPQRLVFLSPNIEIPPELNNLTAKVKLSLPTEKELLGIIRQVAIAWTQQSGRKVVADKAAVHKLARNLTGLTRTDAARLARKAIFDDGAITKSDFPRVMEAKYQLINRAGVLSFEYETANFADVGGLAKLKQWLTLRRAVFHGTGRSLGLDPPKGVMLLGVQGCGKSLAAKAIAGVWGVPLLRLDFGTIYNKYIGESEKNLRDSLQTSEVMAPCVLWVDEIEKGLANGSSDDGVSRRILGTLLTWMAEKKETVFLVATANDVTSLPPELLRKGRFDEIFFVDLPDPTTREHIFCIQFDRRKLDREDFELSKLAEASEGFSGSEIEQAIVSALYVALAAEQRLSTEHLLEEIVKTKPLSVVMKEKIDWLRDWASDRTVPAH